MKGGAHQKDPSRGNPKGNLHDNRSGRSTFSSPKKGKEEGQSQKVSRSFGQSVVFVGGRRQTSPESLPSKIKQRRKNPITHSRRIALIKKAGSGSNTHRKRGDRGSNSTIWAKTLKRQNFNLYSGKSKKEDYLGPLSGKRAFLSYRGGGEARGESAIGIGWGANSFLRKKIELGYIRGGTISCEKKNDRKRKRRGDVWHPRIGRHFDEEGVEPKR